ncbi:MAG: AAA family ATPase [Acidimicrobiia bacterium]|nr:AAA family ATPase [Acidimicrobiia bacterium]
MGWKKYGELAPGIIFREVYEDRRAAMSEVELGTLATDLADFSIFPDANATQALSRLRERRAMLVLQDGIGNASRLADEYDITIPEVVRSLRTLADDAIALAKPERSHLEVIDPAHETYDLAPTGYSWFDGKMPMGAMTYGTKLAISGVPGSGKTALAQQLAMGYLEQHESQHVVWGMAEMSRRELSVRALSCLSGLPLETLRLADDDLTPHQTSCKRKGLERLASIGPRFDVVTSPVTPARIEEAVIDHGARWIVLDYLQLCRPDKPGSTRRDDIDSALREFVEIGQRHEAVMFVLSNMPKDGAKNRDVYSAFKESSEIAHAMDMCLTAIMPDDEEGAELGASFKKDTAYRVVWRCLKARQGGSDIPTVFDGPKLQFAEPNKAWSA